MTQLDATTTADMSADVVMTTVTDNISSTDDVFDVDVYLQQHLGSRHHSAVESASLTAVYLLILLTGVVTVCVVCRVVTVLTGVVGNVVTCIVIVRNSYMHTATNCYLFSLAISDTFQLVLGMFTSLYRQCLSTSSGARNFFSGG